LRRSPSETRNKMPLPITRIARVVGALLISGVPAFLLSRTNWSILTHSIIIGLSAVFFGISEIHFRNIMTEANNVFRRGGFSVWQGEQLLQQVVSLRKRVWLYWNTSLLLKAFVAVGVAVLNSKTNSAQVIAGALFGCYSALLFGFTLSSWASRNYRKLRELGPGHGLRLR
jgi:hypothetical protein